MGKLPKNILVDSIVLCSLSNESLRVLKEYEVLLICILISCSCLFHDALYNMSCTYIVVTHFCIYSMQFLLDELPDTNLEGRHGAVSAVRYLRHHPLLRHFVHDTTGSEQHGEEMACAPHRPAINQPTFLRGRFTYIKGRTYYKDSHVKDSQSGDYNVCRAGQFLVVPIWLCGRGTPVKMHIDCLVKFLYCGCGDKQPTNQDAGQP